MVPPNRFDIFPLVGGLSEDLDAFQGVTALLISIGRETKVSTLQFSWWYVGQCMICWWSEYKLVSHARHSRGFFFSSSCLERSDSRP